MEILNSLDPLTCCGVLEADGIESCDSARGAIVDMAEEYYEEDQRNRAYILYSATGGTRIGHAVAVYIEKYKLGVVHKTRPTLNGNTGNMVTVWLWTINKKNFEAYWHRTNRYKKNYKSSY